MGPVTKYSLVNQTFFLAFPSIKKRAQNELQLSENQTQITAILRVDWMDPDVNRRPFKSQRFCTITNLYIESPLFIKIKTYFVFWQRVYSTYR